MARVLILWYDFLAEPALDMLSIIAGAAIPGGREIPVTTPPVQLAFRKHKCHNAALLGRIAHVDDVRRGVGCNVHCGPKRTELSVCQCAFPLASRELRLHRR